NSPAIANAARMTIDSRPTKWPASAAETSHTPKKAVTAAIVIATVSPIMIKVGEKANRNGTMKAGQPNLTEAQPVLIGSALAIAAAENAASAIGGVIIDITPK